MANQEIYYLFDRHVQDLASIEPLEIPAFVCPICFRVFPAAMRNEFIAQKKISVGHVWPKGIRRRGQNRNQKVVLCKDCNSSTGTKGDSAWQKYEEYRAIFEQGGIFLPVITLEPRDPSDGESITFRAGFEKEGTNVSIIFTRDPRTGQPDHNPAITEKAERYIRNGIRRLEISDAYKAEDHYLLVQAGWYASAYLMAFYTFGYRYILKAYLDPIRRFILASYQETFALEAGRRLDGSDHVELDELPWAVRKHDAIYPEPDIKLVLPLNEHPHHIAVNIDRYGLRLPLKDLSLKLNISPEPLPRLKLPDSLSFDATGMTPNDKSEIFDVAFGNTDYQVDGIQVVRKA
jgi:hypothetical protein